MTQTSNRLFDEMARLMGDAASVAQGVKREAETAFKSQIERLVADMDLVKREEFDVVKDLASKARSENTSLKRRITELEKRLDALEGKPAKASASAKSGAKATAAKSSTAKAAPRARRTRSKPSDEASG